MHTDDDIFESLDIEEGLDNTCDTKAKADSEAVDYLSDETADDYAVHADASDDIFETLDMEDRIYDTAFMPDMSAGGNQGAAANAAHEEEITRRSSARKPNAQSQAAGSAEPDEFDLSRHKRTATGGGLDSNESSGGNVGGGSRGNVGSTSRGNGGRQGGENGDGLKIGLGGAHSGGRNSRKSPRELNTADTSVDGNKVAKDKENKKKSKLKKIIACTLVEIFTLAAIFAYGYVLKSWNMIARPEVRLEAVENNNISVEKKKEMEGYWNIAVFGVDSRGDSVVERGINSDVIMIVSINKDTGDIKIVSVFRDTYLNISSKNSYNKINQAYAIGGPEQALAALNKNLDLNIQHYVAFNWKAVAEGINILGGVDNIPISKAELYYINAYITETVKVTKIGSVQLKNTGEQHLDGVQAVAYGRLRYMDNDFARTERQRNILKAAFAKAKKANFSVLNNIMVVCFPQVATNIEFNEAIDMAQHITQYNIADTGGFPWSRGDANVGSRGDCVIPTTLESNVIKLHEFLFGDTNYKPSDAVLSISEKIKTDSGRYKEGVFIESVATDGGVIQRKRSSTTSETKSPAEEDEETNSSSKNKNTTIGVDEDGNYIYPTDSDGNILIPTDADGNVIYPTDAYGNIIKESSIARPTELSTEDMLPGDLDESDEPLDGPVAPTTASGNATSPGHNTSQTTSSGSGQLSPGGLTSETTTAAISDGPISSNTSSSPSGSTSTSGSSTTVSPGSTSTSGSASSPGSTSTGSSPSGTSSSSSTSSPSGTSSNSSTTAGPGSSSSSSPIISTDGPGSVSTGSTTGPGSSTNAPG